MTLNKSVVFSVILLLTQCLNVIDLATNLERNFSMKEENCDSCTDNNAFKCRGYCYKMQLEDLKQWKRRRRASSTSVDIESLNSRDKRNPIDNAFVNIEKQSFNSEVGTASTENISSAASFSLLGRFKKQWPMHLWRRFLFTDDYLILINPHWLKFPPPSDVLNYSLGGLYILMFLIGTSGNGLVLILYFR